MKIFTDSGLLFRYPEEWTIEVERDGGAWTAQVQSPGTAFAIFSHRPEAESPDALAEECLAALKTEYRDLDIAMAVETLAGLPSVGYDLDFLSVDTPVEARIRALETGFGPLVILMQVGEYDRAEFGEKLFALAKSLEVLEDAE